MTGEALDTSWLDEPATTTTVSDDDWLDEPATTTTVSDDDWLNIEDPNAHAMPAAFRALVEACMPGTERRMAAAGNYLAYRPYNPRTEKVVNPHTRERFQMFIEAGEVKHLATYDDVQIWEFQPGSPYYHQGGKAYVVGQNYWADIRGAATLACERKWTEYHDFLQTMAVAIKSGRDPIFAKAMWDDTVNQVTAQILRRPDAPTEREINEGFLGVRRARGIQGRNGAVLLNSAALERVEFSKGEK
jgi:hypothetical protein